VSDDSRSPSRAAHLWETARVHASTAFVGGLVLVLTGFTPEHWVAYVFHASYLPEGLFSRWPSGLDPRLVVVALGIAIIVADVLWRRHRTERSAAQDAPQQSADLRRASEPRSSSSLALPDKPSIAVLPFTNLSGDSDQEYLADGIVDDVITTLSQVSSLFVVARNSSFKFKGKNSDAREVGQQLGVRYLLEGSVRRSGDRLRVSAQLVDATDGSHVWAERFDRRFQDILDIQDELTKEIVTALRIRLTDGEQASLWLRSTNNVEAWGYATRGADHIWRGTAADNAEARALLERAVECDPGYARATALIALTHYFDFRFNYTSSKGESRQKLAQVASRALELDPEGPYALLVRGLSDSVEGRFDAAIEGVNRAVAKSPNDALGWLYLARVLVNEERPVEAEKAMRHAMRLNPFYPINYLAVLGDALVHQGKAQEALAVFKETVSRQPKNVSAHLHLANLYSSQGQMDAARAEVAEVLRFDPKYRLADAGSFYISSNEERKREFIEDLRRAGLPE
jgi:adenylate cyclase